MNKRRRRGARTVCLPRHRRQQVLASALAHVLRNTQKPIPMPDSASSRPGRWTCRVAPTHAPSLLPPPRQPTFRQLWTASDSSFRILLPRLLVVWLLWTVRVQTMLSLQWQSGRLCVRRRRAGSRTQRTSPPVSLRHSLHIYTRTVAPKSYLSRFTRYISCSGKCSAPCTDRTLCSKQLRSQESTLL